MNKTTLKIWGRAFDLSIEYDCYAGESILPYQLEAAATILRTPEKFDAALDGVKAYCSEKNSAEIGSDSIENIFKYVKPQSLYVQRTKDESHVVGLMCAYKFDSEHGMAIRFKDGVLQEIGTQDIIL